MPKFYSIVYLLVFIFCIGSLNKVQSQTNNEGVIFNADNISAAGGGLFTYTNQNSTVFGRLQDGNLGPGDCACYAGTTLKLQSRFEGSLSITGGNPGMVNGNLYNQIFFSGSLFFDGGSYVLPFRYSRSPRNITFPATLTGFLNAHTANPFTQIAPPVFTSQISLQGTVTVSLQVAKLLETPSGIKPIYKILKVKYNFPRTSQSFQNGENLNFLTDVTQK